MNIKSGFIVTIIIFVAAIGGFYIFLKKQQSPSVAPISAVPINTALIIEIKQPLKFFEEIAQTNAIYSNLNQLKEVNDFFSSLSGIDSLISHNEKLRHLLSNTPLLVSMHDVGKNEFRNLFVMPVGGHFESGQIQKAIELSFSPTLTSKRYNGGKIYSIAGSQHPFYYCFTNGLLLGSNSETLLQDAIRQSDAKISLLNNEGLVKLMNTSGDHAPANIYIQFKYFQSFANKMVSENFLKSQIINQLADWVELDLNVKNQTLLFNGFAFADASANRFMNLFQGQTPQRINFLSFTPTDAEAFWAFGISNYNAYKQNLKRYMSQAGEADRLELNSNILSQTFGEQAETKLEIIFRNEIAQVVLPNQSSVFYIKTQGFRDASELLNKWLQFYCDNNTLNFTDFVSNYSIDKDAVFPIYKMPLEFLPTRIFGPFFKDCKAGFATVFDDYIIFGDSHEALSKIIYDNVLQKTIVYNPNFNQFADYLSDKVNFFAFISLSESDRVIESRTTANAYQYYKNNQKVFGNFYGLAWQFAVENNLYYNNVLFRHQPTKSVKLATEWETKLDTVIAFKPQLVINHSTNEKEIFVQDAKNNIYLINSSGRILWKKNIEAPIMGEVYQVDYYKNGKYQYLFNTKSKLHLIDRNGNFVERYPLTLAANAAASLSVFDYEKTKSYRLFVPLKNNKIEVYNIEGKVVAGFKFTQTDNPIISPIQYIRDKNNEYIVVTDQSRIYILDRQGNVRVNPKMQFSASVNNKFEYEPGNAERPSRLVRTDQEGTIYYIYFNGEIETKSIHACSPNHYFSVEDVTNDKANDFIFIDSCELSVFGLTGQNIYTYTFSTPIQHSPAFYKFSATNICIGITEADARKIYLFSSNGNIVSGFPKTGSTQFSIGALDTDNNQFNLVVGSDEYYLYNYKLK